MCSRPVPLALALAFAAASAFGIPQNFNPGGFFIANGVAFENFATDKAPWLPGAPLKGEWSAPDAGRVQRLKGDAVVFGLPAAEITAQRDDYRVTKLRVVFREPKKNSRPLLERVLQNVRAFTGESRSVAGNGPHKFRHAAAQISVQGTAANEVVVEFTPVS